MSGLDNYGIEQHAVEKLQEAYRAMFDLAECGDCYCAPPDSDGNSPSLCSYCSARAAVA